MIGFQVSSLHLIIPLEKNGRAVFLLKKKAKLRKPRKEPKLFELAESLEGKFNNPFLRE